MKGRRESIAIATDAKRHPKEGTRYDNPSGVNGREL
jgi:hypothetical protein